jgi:hypothetical protein
MEPVLRWLHCGGRGYKFGCLSKEDQLLNQCSSPAYADDLLCLTHTIRDMQVQANKITQFCEWAKMSVNAKKCGATGIRYKTDGAANNNPISVACVAALERSFSSTVSLQGHHVPFHHPDKEPYVYLGVPITATLNYKVYYQGIITTEIKRKNGPIKSEFCLWTPTTPNHTTMYNPRHYICIPCDAGRSARTEPVRCDPCQMLCAKRSNSRHDLRNRMVHLACQAGWGLGHPVPTSAVSPA